LSPPSRLRRLRTVLGALVLLGAAGLAGLALRPRPAAPPSPAADGLLPPREGVEGATELSTRLDFTRTRAGRLALRVQADRILGREGTSYRLEAPRIEVHGEDGRVTRVVGERGAFDTAREEGRIEGGARALTSTGLEVAAPALVYRPGGEVMEAEEEAQFARGAVRGRGRGLRYVPSTGRLTLDGDVRIEGSRPGGDRPAWRLQADRLDYGTAEGTMTTGPFLLVERGGSLRGRRLDLSLDPATSEPRSLVASGDAVLREAADLANAGRLEGERIEIEPAGSPDREPARVVATGGARLRPGRVGPGEVRGLDAERIDLRRENGDPTAPRRLHAAGGVRLRLDDDGAEAQLDAASLEADLAAADRLEAGVARGGVRLRGARGDASAGTAWFEAAGDRLRFEGGGSSPASLNTAERRVTAREIRLERGAGLLHAEGDVRTVSAPGEGGLFEAGIPVHGCADSLRAARDEDLAIYQGAVRLWQGDSLLQADRVEARRAEGLLQADGRVVTRTPVRGRDGELRPVQARAGHLTYRDRDAQAVYEEDVALDLAPDLVEARRVEVSLDDRREVRRVVARGAVRLRFGPRRGRGDHLDWRPGDQIAVLLGDGRLAEVEDIENQRLVRGSSLTFDLADGSIRLQAAPGGRNWITLNSRQGGVDPEAVRDGPDLGPAPGN
jgi:lipopolysaccharide export system protein LptA